MGAQFHETGYGRKFFEHDVPSIADSLKKIAKQLTTGEDKKRAALQDALATLTRWREHAPEAWDERDEETYNNIVNALKEK